MNKKYGYTLLALFCLSALLFSCKPKLPYTTPGDRAFNASKYYIAIGLYKKASKRPVTLDEKKYIQFRTGECYYYMNNPKQAESWYAKAIKAGIDTPAIHLQYAWALMAMDKIEDAMEQLDIYQKKKPEDTTALRMLNSCRLAIKWKDKTKNFDVYVVKGINSKQADFAPTFFQNGLIFTSTREPVKGKNFDAWTGNGYLNLYTSTKNNKNIWSKPEMASKAIYTPFNEGAGSFDEGHQLLYYTQCNGLKGKGPACKIFVATYNGDKWLEPKPIEIEGMDTLSDYAHPSISADGNTLYYISNQAGGFGDQDLYYSTKTGDNKWSAPINLGPIINTKNKEVYPFIHADGSLYFSSTGHLGIGALDIFYSENIDGNWTEPINLKGPLNSSADDFGIILDKDKEEGYFASNRIGGKGDDDIYNIVALPLEYNVAGKVYNAIDNKVIPDAKVSITGSDGTENSITTDRTGSYKFKLTRKTSYDLMAQKKKFFSDKGTVSTINLKESKDFMLNFKLLPIPITINLKGILYDLNKADLRPESMIVLDSLYKILDENLNLVIELASHTDSRNDSAYNQELSQRRAQTAIDYLIAKGVEPERLVAKGYGESKLLNECKDGVECTEEQHQINRRTEFSILREDFISKKMPVAPPEPLPGKGKKKKR